MPVLNLSRPSRPILQAESQFYCVSARKMRSGWRYQIQFWSTETSTTDPELVLRRSSHLPNQNTFYCVLAGKMRLSPRYQLSVGGTGPGPSALNLSRPSRPITQAESQFYCVPARKMGSGWRYQIQCWRSGPYVGPWVGKQLHFRTKVQVP